MTVTNQELANAIRVLSMDAIEQAKSGHPGMPMGMADIAVALWKKHLRHNPANPQWTNRDRFVLSNGHGSMLLYSLLHLSGYDLSLEDLKQFRQLHSKTPGHPEYGYTVGVETTTGPLGQGISNAVGMALAEKMLAAEFNRDGFKIVDHYTYVFLGDGCLMEGISHEACSLAGTWGLGKLIALYDDNKISIDGDVAGWFSDDTAKRFEAYGWHVIAKVDGHDAEAVSAAIAAAQAVADRPSLICCQTVIGKGAPNKQGGHDVHGAPLGAAEIAAAKQLMGWDNVPFAVPEKIREEWNARAVGAAYEQAWQLQFDAYRQAYPELAAEFVRRSAGDLPQDWQTRYRAAVDTVNARAETIATRKASQNAIALFAEILPELVGGSADLTPSNLTSWAAAKSFAADAGASNYVHYGVREFGMAAIMNGMVLHGGVRPFGGTFLMFSEYARNALRMAALMKIAPIFVFTHDSIGLGEDGPTHQPVEQIATLRMIPNMDVWRPCDTVESVVAWGEALSRRTNPSCLIFSRQNLPFISRSQAQIDAIRRGGYILRDVHQPKAVILATGSEVELALKAQEILAGDGLPVRVVSMPSTRVFDLQDAAYRTSVLGDGLPRVAIEAGVTDFWRKYVGLDGVVIGLDQFGESAPAGDLFKHFGITVDALVAAVKSHF